MDADLLRKARNLGGVTSDVSSRSQMFTSNPGKSETKWSRLYRAKKPK